MNRFEIGKPPLRANAEYPPFEAPAKIKAAMQKTPGSSPIVFVD